MPRYLFPGGVGALFPQGAELAEPDAAMRGQSGDGDRRGKSAGSALSTGRSSWATGDRRTIHSAASDLWRYATTRLCALFPLRAVGASLRIRRRGGSRKIVALAIAQRLNDIRAQAYAQSALMYCSTILGRHALEAAEIEGSRMLDVCIRSGDNYILNWAYWSIAWDYVCRGLTNKARIWALKLIDAGRERQDDRALGMAYWTLALIDIQDRRFGDAIANAQRCRKTAATPFDRKTGTIASAIGLLLEGRIEEGLAELLAQRKSALTDGWLYSASGVDFAAGPALAMTGRIAEGIQMLKAGIAACDATGDRSMASWNRVALAELFLRMLSSEKRPSFKFILSNLGAITWVLIFGRRQAWQLLGEAAQNGQIHELSTSRGWIEIDLAKLCILKKKPHLARQHLRRAQLAAEAQESAIMSNEIDAILASLR